MRADSTALVEANSSLSKEPRYIIEMAFDDAATDLVYFTSHSDAPLPESVTSYDGILNRWTNTTQGLQPEKANASIGDISFSLTDKDQTIRELLAVKYTFGYSLKGKRIRAYMAYKGMAWSDATLVQTQIIDVIDTKDGEYHFKCSDVQRFLRKKIFTLKTTTIQSDISSTSTTISVAATTEFEMVAHGSSYSDAPNATVGYVKIDDEIIRYSGKTSTTFTGCVRGVLNTKAASHKVGSSSVDRRTKVEEVVYLEMPAPKLIYALLTGSLYGQGASLPEHWSAGIDPAYIRDASFTGIGDDFWNTANDLAGLPCRFVGEKEQDAKKFIETQLLLMIGCYMPVHGDGALGLRRMVNVLPDAPYVAELTVDNTVSYSKLTHNLPEIKNHISIGWNWESTKEEYTRHNVLIDGDSVAVYGQSDLHKLNFKGLHGSLHTSKTIDSLFERLRDRFTSEPLLINVAGFFSLNNIEIGDIVYLKNEHIQDYIDNSTVNRSYEVQRISVDWFTGKVSLSLFGSTLKPSPKILSETEQVADDSWYTSAGTNISTLSGYANGALTSSVSIGGNANLQSAGAIYYHDGDLTINGGVNLNISENIQLRVKGFLTVNGTINGKGAGHTAANQRGYVGSAKAQGGIYTAFAVSGTSTDVAPVAGIHSAAPELALVYKNSALTGLPTDLRGTTGSDGGTASLISFGGFPSEHQSGGAAGNSGAGLCIISKGLAFGVSGKIDVSGNDGVTGLQLSANFYLGYLFSGTGAGGSAGTVYVLLDGNNAIAGIGSNNIIANRGKSTPAVPQTTSVSGVFADYTSLRSSYYSGFPLTNYWQSHHRIQYIPQVETPVVDVGIGVIPAPTNLKAESGTQHLLPLEGGTIVARVLLSFTPADDSRVVGYQIQFKLSTDTKWISSTAVLGADSDKAYVLGVSSGVDHDFRIRAADHLQNSSEWITLTNYPVVGKEELPPKVTGFIVSQNGEDVVLKWDASGITDSAGFEFRYAEQGTADYSSARELTISAKGTQLTSKAIPPGSYRFFAKEVDTGGRVSEFAAYYDATISTAHDIIYDNNEHLLWDGYLNGFKVENNTLIPTRSDYAEYTSNEIDLGFNDVVRVWSHISALLSNIDSIEDYGQASDPVTDINDYGLASETIQGIPEDYGSAGYSVGGESVNVVYEVATRKEGEPYFSDFDIEDYGLASEAVVDTEDYGLASEVISGEPENYGRAITFRPWVIGDIDMRYIIHRITVYPNESGSLPAIKNFTTTLDIKERTESKDNLSVSIGGSRFNFDKRFHLKPKVNLRVISDNDIYVIPQSIDVFGFNVKARNSAGTEIAISNPDQFEYDAIGK